MRPEQAKCFFFTRTAYKESGDSKSAFPILEKVATDFGAAAPEIAAHALIELGEMYVAEASDSRAAECFTQAMSLLAGSKKPALLAPSRQLWGKPTNGRKTQRGNRKLSRCHRGVLISFR
jgi:hypothetical protein